MPENKTAGSSERLREIIDVLRKYRAARGVTPEKLRLILEDLGPTFVKFGQIMSMRTDMLPLPYCEELCRLRTDVRPMSYEEAADEVERALGKPVGELFARFDRRPIGSASIAQVHYAELKSGEHVVVKIRRPGIRDVMERDVALLHRVSGLLRIAGGTGNSVDFNQVIDEIWSAALTEMDFVNEAAQAEEFARLNADVAYVSCPRVLRQYSGESVLTMEYVDGLSVDEPEKLKAAGYDTGEIGVKLAENYVKQIVDDGFFHADPHPGNLRIRGGKIVWLDMGMMGHLSQRDRRLFRGAISAAVRGDVNELCNLLLVFCEPKEPVDRPRLFTDVDSLINRYETLDVGSMNLLEIRNDVVAMAERNGLVMPKGVSVLGRGLVTIEGVLGPLSPEINMMEVMVNHLSGRVFDSFDPQEEMKKALAALYQSGRRIPQIPSQVSELLRMGIRGQTKTNIELVGSDQPLHLLDRIADRIAAGFIECGLLVGSSILCTSNLPQCFPGVPTAAAVGFALAALLGVRMAWGAFRRKK
jgi:ubiquinone biosynthesis protein